MAFCVASIVHLEPNIDPSRNKLFTMKCSFLSLLLTGIFTLTALAGYAQTDKSTRPSPPVEVKGVIQEVNITISYSAPSVKGRTIWGDLVPYGKVWRTGANEATTFETDKDLVIQDQPLPAGKYALFTIPGKEEWIWVFNSVWDQWGAYKYDEAKDVLRIKATPQKSPVYNEQLKFEITEGRVSLYWENLDVRF
jgi:hypothetical protein